MLGHMVEWLTDPRTLLTAQPCRPRSGCGTSPFSPIRSAGIPRHHAAPRTRRSSGLPLRVLQESCKEWLMDHRAQHESVLWSGLRGHMVQLP